jgi:KipI family sensor histidine kinase inhibitor
LTGPRVLPVGDAALTVELGHALDLRTNARVRALDRALRESPPPGVRETVPTLRSLLVLYDPTVVRFDAIARGIGTVAAAVADEAEAEPRRHEIPARYGGEDGPDLAPLASMLGLAPAALAALHASAEYTALMLGFTPGFAYLGLLPGGLDVPRRDTPRVRVPAGSLAAAGAMTAVYPSASAGGWRLLGRTSVRFFDPWRAEPALVAPGDRVRFVPVAELAPSADAAPPSPARRAPVAEVLEPGLLTTVQDEGRGGFRRLGVSAGGPLDARAHATANRAVGNHGGAPALECTIAGPTLRFLAPVRFAIAGADLGAILERDDLGAWPVPRGAAILARPGNVLRFAGRREGCRATIALAGGVDVPLVLGSASTDLLGGFGGQHGRPLGAGDRLAARALAARAPVEAPPVPLTDRATVRVVLGPQAGRLDPVSVRAFLRTAWRVGTASDRVGLRLEAEEPLRHRGRAEIPSDGMVPGAVQVPPDGKPIVMLADGPTTGGYPKVATVIAADLPLLGQLVPGAGEVRFEAVRLEDVQGL